MNIKAPEDVNAEDMVEMETNTAIKDIFTEFSAVWSAKLCQRDIKTCQVRRDLRCVAQSGC